MAKPIGPFSMTAVWKPAREHVHRQMRLVRMRTLHPVLLSGFLMVAAGCSAAGESTIAASSPEPAAAAFPLGSTVESPSEAAAAGRHILETAGGVKWVDGPRTVLAEAMSYEEAVARVGVGEGEYDRWSPATPVWLVIFQGSWDLTPLGPSGASPPPVRYEGCVLTVLTAADGTMMSMGDAVCPIAQ